MSPASNTPLRHVIIGAGAGIFNGHKLGIALDTTEVVGLCDVQPDPGTECAAELGCPFYLDHKQMLTETNPDVAVIITPHPYHVPVALDCIAAGCHVLVEKPLAIHAGEADLVVDAAAKADRLLAVNFQQRFRPEIVKARELIQSGALGEIQHMDMTLAWTRTDAYYRSGGWRATWKGEGGGLLLNQAPHDLDIICHLLGMPQRVYAWTATMVQNIETEDTVQAMLGWENGAMGSVHISTAEGARPYRLEIIGTRGLLNVSQGSIELSQYDQDVVSFIRESEERFPKFVAKPVDVTLEEGSSNHETVYQNFHQAILAGTPIMCDGAEARMSLELANAMIYSSVTRGEVNLPLDRDAYVGVLEKLKSGELSIKG